MENKITKHESRETKQYINHLQSSLEGVYNALRQNGMVLGTIMLQTALAKVPKLLRDRVIDGVNDNGSLSIKIIKPRSNSAQGFSLSKPIPAPRNVNDDLWVFLWNESWKLHRYDFYYEPISSRPLPEDNLPALSEEEKQPITDGETQ